jgi:hypothetical protein
MADVKYYWWNGADLAEFWAEVARRGYENVRIAFSADTELLYVLSNDEKVAEIRRGGGGYNFVKTCPPDCI